MRRPRLAASLLVVSLGCSSTGVGNPTAIDQRDQALIESGHDATHASDTASALASVPTIALSDSSALQDAATVASVAESSTALYFEPAGCLAATRDLDTVTFDFQGCRTGAVGLAELTGQLVATYAVTRPGSVDVQVSTPAPFSIGPTEITLDVQVSFGLSGTTRSVQWNGSYHAERPVRPDLDHEATYSASYDTVTRCLTLAGSSTTTFADDAGLECSLSDYVRCGPSGTCPSSGTLTLTELPDRERSFTIEYDGDTTARVRERDADITLSCSE